MNNSQLSDQIEFAAFYRRSLARIPERDFATGRVATRDIAPDKGDARNSLAMALTRSPARFAGSGLDAGRAELARDLVAQAAWLALRHAADIDYVRGARRWEGIDRGLRADRGDYPRHADCSSFATWVLWQALSHFGVGDVVNGTNWQAGYVG